MSDDHDDATVVLEQRRLLDEQRRQLDAAGATIERLERQLAQKDELTSTNPRGPLVAFLTPAYDGVKPSYVHSLIESMRLLAREGYRTKSVFSWGCSIISNARAELFGDGWRMGADVCAMIDSDVGWDPQDLLTCVRANEPMIVLPVPVRRVDLETMIDRDRKVEGVTFNVWPSPEEIAPREVRGGFVRVDGAGGAFTVYKRAASESMVRHFGDLAVKIGAGELRSWALWHPMILHEVELGEDTSFFSRWRAIGGEIWCLPSAKTSHAGELVLEARLSDRMREAGDDVTALSTTRYGP